MQAMEPTPQYPRRSLDVTRLSEEAIRTLETLVGLLRGQPPRPERLGGDHFVLLARGVDRGNPRVGGESQAPSQPGGRQPREHLRRAGRMTACLGLFPLLLW